MSFEICRSFYFNKSYILAIYDFFLIDATFYMFYFSQTISLSLTVSLFNTFSKSKQNKIIKSESAKNN